VLIRISQVGEGASKTSPEALAAVSGVIWRDIKGIRGKIVHDDQAVDALVIRGVVSRQLPRLITIVRKALAAEEQSTKRSNATSTPPRRSSAGAAPPRSRPPARRPLEAMLRDVPVVAANAGSLPEVLGEAALFHDPDDYEAVTTHIESLLQDDALRHRQILRGRDRAAKYRWDRAGAAAAAVLRRAIATGRRG
jgi:hypothetical protein